ncbi:hypothetical protein, partial [Klebsiella sp. Kpp]|uniref:hypothetical protein n=1 Tax=Klebsiella sp. Kpp TaxID=2758578 RepID=UPI001C990D81
LINWTKPIKILAPNPLASTFDNQGIYRSSIVKVGNMFFVFYSAISTTNARSMAISYSDNPLALRGFSETLEQLVENKG